MRVVRTVLLAAAMVLAACSEKPGTIGTGGTPTPPASAAPSGYFPAFWPVATLDAAQALQEQVDGGADPWRLDAAKVAAEFGKERFDWTVQPGTTDVTGSEADGWKATVKFRPLIGEAEPPEHPGPLHTAELIGLEGAAKPAWFVASLHSESIVLDAPAQDALVTSPIQAAGRGTAYEGTIVATVADDAGKDLGPGSPGNVLQGGAMEPAPFSGALAFAEPEAAAGTLTLVGDTGAGPTPSATIVRVRFR
ncbi:MAG: Gmad2 immunoglobulin-like domain-containing protein [Actinomycetota bacterium]